MSCIFCNLDKNRVIATSEFFVAIRDAYPVTQGHTLIIPKRHALTWFDLSESEQSDLNAFLHKQKQALQLADTSISGFNIGMNCGEDAGQTVMHCHVHLIPRRKGDCEKPKGGVRGVIPEKQQY